MKNEPGEMFTNFCHISVCMFALCVKQDVFHGIHIIQLKFSFLWISFIIVNPYAKNNVSRRRVTKWKTRTSYFT